MLGRRIVQHNDDGDGDHPRHQRADYDTPAIDDRHRKCSLSAIMNAKASGGVVVAAGWRI